MCVLVASFLSKAGRARILRGEGWVVRDALPGVQMAVNRAHAEMDTGMPSMVEVMPKPWPTPPTHFKLNAFTIAFQVSFEFFPRYLAVHFLAPR